MPVHPQAQAFLDQAANGPGLHEMSVATRPAMMDAMAALAGPPEPVASVDDLEIQGPGGAAPPPRLPTDGSTTTCR